MYFLTVFDVSTADTNALFAAVLPPLKGPGKVVFGERPHDPLPLRPELAQAHGEPASSLFSVGKRK